MGRQINFFMHPDDLQEFELEIKKNPEVIILAAKSDQKKPTILNSLGGKMDCLGIYLTRKKLIDQVKLEYIAMQKYWLIDGLTSPAVEFDDGFFDGKILRRGRIYFETGFYDTKEKWQEKPEEFIKCGDSLIRWIRKKYKKDSKSGLYIGHCAEKWQKSQKGIFEF